MTNHRINYAVVGIFVLAILVSLVAVYFGYNAKPTGAGVGTATTNTVVVSSVLILVFDFIMTSFFT